MLLQLSYCHYTWGITSVHRFQQISISLAAPDQLSIDKAIKDFFLANQSPTDKQVHELAESINLTPEQLEERIYQMFSKLLQAS